MLKLTLIILSLSFYSFAEKLYITTDSDAINTVQGFAPSGVRFVGKAKGVAVFETDESQASKIGKIMHHVHKRCGGFVAHKTKEEAISEVNFVKMRTSPGGGQQKKTSYSIDQGEKVKGYLNEAEESKIRAVIEKLSGFKNRYYKSKYGVASSKWIAGLWTKISEHRNDVKVGLISHKSWPQESIYMAIEGSEKPEEIVIIGGHADSINGNNVETTAPGADDNASGMATITEVIRVAMKMGYKPKRTVMFMGYAAEEVGLRGSQEIAKTFKSENKKVVGVMQLDMTGHHGTSNKDIVMMSDFTNKYQNEFLGALMDKYTPEISWGYSRCGYGCSDHASWDRQGYPASMPFESTMEDINHKIHSTQDTLDTMGGDASHSLKFAKLALAYMVELAK